MAVDDTLTSAELRHLVIRNIRSNLPPAWRVTEELEGFDKSSGRDVELGVAAPDGRRVRLVIEIKHVIERRDVARLRELLSPSAVAPNDVPVVGARYIPPSVREALVDNRLSFVDATGNVRISCDSPAFFVAVRGEDRDPWRRGRPRGTLKGEPAARVVRALLDYHRSWRVRELIAASAASSGATYRVLDYLQREDLVAKTHVGYEVTDWERLLRAWSADAPFQTSTRVMAFIEPRGIDRFLENVSTKRHFPVAVTGSAAAREWASFAPVKSVFVYVSSIQEASEQWGLRPNAAAPNVVLLEPRTLGDVPFRNSQSSAAGYPIAAPAQVAADLLNGPGREPSAGEFLIDWMRRNERGWRRE